MFSLQLVSFGKRKKFFKTASIFACRPIKAYTKSRRMISPVILKKNAQINLAGIFLLFVLSALVIPLIFNFPTSSYLIILTALIIFIIAFLKVELALIILIFSMLLSPEIKLGGIPERFVVLRFDDIFLFLVFLGWIAKTALNKQLALLKSTPLNTPIIIYIIICVVSSLLGIMRGEIKIAHSFFYLLKYIEYFVLFFMVANSTRNERQIRIFLLFILITSFLVCLYGYTQIASGERLSAPFEKEGGEPNTLGGYLVFIIGVISGLIVYNKSGAKRFLLLGLLAFTIIPLLRTLSRGSWFAFFPMSISLALLTKKRKLVILTFLFALFISLPFLLPERVIERVKETFTPGKKYSILGRKITFDESSSARIETWKETVEELKRRPLLGFGVPATAVIDNQYARTLRETGLFGFSAFSLILIMIFRLGFWAYKKSAGNDFFQGLSLGFLAGYCGLLAHGLTAATFIIIRIMEPFWFLTALIVTLPEIATSKDYSR